METLLSSIATSTTSSPFDVPTENGNATTTTNNNNNPASAIIFIAYLLAVSELMLHSTVLVISVLNLVVLTSSRCLHPNLRFILICQSASIAMFDLLRSALVANKFIVHNIFQPGNIVFQVSIGMVSYFRSSIPHLVILERILASVFFHKYEKWKNPYFSMCSCVVLAFIALAIALSSTESWTASMFHLMFPLIFVVFSVLEIFIFGLIRVRNMKRYDLTLKENASKRDYSLSEKYQLSENIRTGRQLLPTFICHFFGNSVLLLIQIFTFFQILTQTPHQFSLFLASSSILASVFNAGIEVTMITHHPMLKKRFLSLVKKALIFQRNVRVEDVLNNPTGIAEGTTKNSQKHQQPRDIHGDILIRELDADNHFRMLDIEWR